MLVHEAAVVAGGVGGVVDVGAEGGGEVAAIEQQLGAVEGGAHAGHDGQVQLVACVGEGARVAAPDVDDGRLGVREAVARAGHLVARGAARHLAPLALRVDDQVLVGVLGPHLVDVVRVVAVHRPRVRRDVHVRGQDAQRRAVLARHAHFVPRLAVLGRLALEAGADVLQRAGGQSLHGLDLARAERQPHAHDDADEVDEGDVGVDAALVVGELDEAPVLARGGVGGVREGRLDQADLPVAGDDGEELELAVGHPDAGRGDVVRDAELGGGADGAEGDGVAGVGGDGDGDLAAGRVGVVELAGGVDQDDLVVAVPAGDVDVELLPAEVVDEGELQGVGRGRRVRAGHGAVHGVLGRDDDGLHTAGGGDDGPGQGLANEGGGGSHCQSKQTTHDFGSFLSLSFQKYCLWIDQGGI